MQLRTGHALALTFTLAAAGAVFTGCGSDGSSGGGGGGAGGSTGGQGGATGGSAGASTGGLGGLGGSAGSAVGGAAGSAGAAGAGGTTTAPMCTTSADCKEADMSYPNSTDPPTATPTDCLDGQCGTVGSYSGSYKSPKTPRSCDDICSASTYEGQAMKCAPSCKSITANGFGDKSLTSDPGDAGAGSVAGLVRYQFSPLSGGYKFLEVGCSEVPKSKLIQGSNSYTYVLHQCCCVAP